MRSSTPLDQRQAEAAIRFLRARFQKGRLKNPPKLAVILGSGMGQFAESLEIEWIIPYESIPHFPTPQVAGHAGNLVLARHSGGWLFCLQGRAHLYEGHSVHTITLPVRVLGALGLKQLVVTNAAGAANPRLRPGQFMLISDHVSLFVPNPLVGRQPQSQGFSFPDMSECYSLRLRQIASRWARKLRLKVQEGVYVAVSGPSYETPAEIRWLRRLGGDAVGMSTVPEIMVARQMGVECLGVSLMTNLAAGLSRQPLSHAEVISTAAKREPALQQWRHCICGEILRLG
ncbi:MAG: purine-nucleoside phosphorylase [Terriglobia bacterium]